MTGGDTFNTYYEYDINALKRAFPQATDQELYAYQSDRNLIPYDMGDKVLKYQREVIAYGYIVNNVSVDHYLIYIYIIRV